MTITDLYALSPLAAIAATALAVMISISIRRSHIPVAILTFTGLALAFVLLFAAARVSPRTVTQLMIIDHFALFYMGLILAATMAVAALSFGYLSRRPGDREEYYLLLLLAAFGSMTLVSGTHFASLFLGLEILSVSLYGLIAYDRTSGKGIEAGIKYLVLAAASAAFLVFGMALVYAASGSLGFEGIAAYISSQAGRDSGILLLAGSAMIIVGAGFKLAVVPFHLWTPDVYEGAPAPVTAFVATVSKGAVFALLLRLAGSIQVHDSQPLFTVFSVIAFASMLAGNLLALFQENVKRILAYSSIAHLGYLLVAFLASGSMAVTASTFYLAAYFVTTLGAFGIITVLSDREREADELDDYCGLAWQRPWLAAVFTAMLLSLAGIPLTAGFIGKFYAITAGAGSSLWLLVITMVISSCIGLFYYLRVIARMYAQPEKHPGGSHFIPGGIPFGGGALLALLTLALLWLGVYPSPLIGLIRKMVEGLQ